jgi:hypothetical protein
MKVPNIWRERRGKDSETKFRSEIYDTNEWGDSDNEILMREVANSSNKERATEEMGGVLFKILEKGKKVVFDL